MQQLTRADLQAVASQTADSIQLALPLPVTPLKTEQLASQIGAALGMNSSTPDWGADRFQVCLSNQQMRCVLCIEWLCEAIWLEPTGTTDLAGLWRWLSQTQA